MNSCWQACGALLPCRGASWAHRLLYFFIEGVSQSLRDIRVVGQCTLWGFAITGDQAHRHWALRRDTDSTQSRPLAFHGDLTSSWGGSGGCLTGTDPVPTDVKWADSKVCPQEGQGGGCLISCHVLSASTSGNRLSIIQAGSSRAVTSSSGRVGGVTTPTPQTGKPRLGELQCVHGPGRPEGSEGLSERVQVLRLKPAPGTRLSLC